MSVYVSASEVLSERAWGLGRRHSLSQCILPSRLPCRPCYDTVAKFLGSWKDGKKLCKY